MILYGEKLFDNTPLSVTHNILTFASVGKCFMMFSGVKPLAYDHTSLTDCVTFDVFAVPADNGHPVPVVQPVHICRQLCRVVRLCVQLA